MITVTLIGYGNVAQHLAFAFADSSTVKLMQIYSRSAQTASSLPDSVFVTDNLDALSETDLYIIAVSDRAIGEIDAKLPFKNRFVVHTSGSMPLETLGQDNRRGVFYPLQTFSKNKAVDFSSVPLCLETEFPFDYVVLDAVAKAISENVFTINSQQRKALHVAAVFVNNFVNHLYGIGNALCDEHQVPFEILKPLIRETAEKVMTLTPNEAQTGPAVRKDEPTIESHLDFISEENHKKIYQLLTNSIQSNGKNL